MLVDILLPFYGDVDLMKQTVKSVLAQNNPNWRLIVVDDGYPDDSIPGWFAALSDSRIIYHRNETNFGANGNYRRCLEFAESELCVIMGADDLMEPDFVKNAIDLHTQFPNAATIHPGVSVINEVGIEIATKADKIKSLLTPWHNGVSELRGEKLAASLMHGNWMYFPAIIWKTSVIKAHKFRAGLNVCQDLGLAIDLIKSGHSMVISDVKTFKYRRHAGSDSSIRAIRGDRFVEERAFFNGLAVEFENMGWKNAARNARLRLSSRLHALSLLPTAIIDQGNVKLLIQHVVKN